MKRILFIIVVLGIYTQLRAQTATVIKFDKLKSMIDRQNDTTYVYNFWATWCAGCVEEFPNFQKLSATYSTNKLKVVFVSLDFKKNLEKQLQPFITKRNVTDPVYLLDETDYNSWIDQVDSSWDGNIPATLVVNTASNVHQMFPHEFTFDQLDQAIKPFIH
jgi:thiol-disulfide isomerase/thioredoxin